MTRANSEISEAAIEAYLRQRVKAMGGHAYKFVSPGNDGVPDRLVLLPGGHSAFVELKAPGKHSTPLQRYQQERMRALGCRVYTDVDGKNKVDGLLEEMMG